MAKKLEENEKQKEEIKNLKKEKKELTKKLEDSEMGDLQRADLEELLQIKTEQHQSSLNQHTEQIAQQCRLVEALQNQT